jgi:hypothetical protein
MAASTHKRKRAVITALQGLGDAGPKAIAAAMGPEWLEPKKFACFVQTLKVMERSHLVMRAGRGNYRVSPSCSWRGLDVRDATRAAIGRFLRHCGGVARTRDVHQALTDRRLSGPDRDYDHRRVTLALKAHFRQDFGRGYWNLAEDELEEVPLLGRWADYQHQVAWFEKGDHGGFASWEAQRDDFFDRVGSAFMDARGARDIEALAAQTDVFYALREMEGGAPVARMKALEALRVQVTKDMAAEGVSDLSTIAQEVRNRKDDGLAVYLYRAFEQGDPELHMAAPVEFYRACAILFGVCPARLSRGEVMPRPSECVSAAIPAATAAAFGGEA